MTDEEVMARVVAILTKTREYVGEDAPEPDSEGDVLLNELVKDIFPRSVDIDDDATPQEVANAIAKAMSGPIFAAFGAFAAAFHQLAAEHDRDDPEVSSAQVLRDLALRASSE
ncbi:hypothetical protein [Streptomyces sp. NPDC060027]|uniref:hypothetical protein n=1 Tax=Streptomyces sp. NPDC060027 TaxID=3347040 RepID=UPI0036B176BB